MVKVVACVHSLEADGKSVVKKVKIHHSGEEVEVKQNITCKDSFCLYILNCTKQGFSSSMLA